MLKRQVEIGGEYAWQEQYSFDPNEYRKVTLLKFLDKPSGRHALVRDEDGKFETHLGRLIKPWSALGSKDKESDFRTRAEKYEHDERHWCHDTNQKAPEPRCGRRRRES